MHAGEADFQVALNVGVNSPVSSRTDTRSQPSSPVAPEYSPLSAPTGTSVSSPSSSSPLSMESISKMKALHRSTPAFPTFKLVGYNLDKYVKPREMRVNVKAQMLNYFNMCAVRDRLDASELPDNPSLPDPITTAKQVEVLLPKVEDHKTITSNFSILVGRVLKKYMPFFGKFGSGLEKHIQYAYSREISQKSEVVSVNLVLLSYDIKL